MSEKLKIGIIGCGGIANGKHMPSLARLTNVEMVAFCDIIVEKAEKAAKEYGIEGAKVYEDYKELLKDESIDVIHVLTPNISHSPITVDALEAGKHVMCEKPMAKTYADALKMLEAAKRTGKKLTIGYQSRHRANSIYMKDAVENGDLGEIYYGKAHAIRRRAVPTWGVFLDEEKQGGGPLIDIGTHALDLTLYMMNNYEVASVTGSVYRKLADQTDQANAFGPWDPKEFTVEDSAMGFIKMKNGATVNLEASWALNTLDVEEATCSLCGTKAGADMHAGLGNGAGGADGMRINGVKYNKQYVQCPDLSTGGVAFFEGGAEPAEVREARLWIDAIINDTTPVTTPEQAIVVTRVLEAIYESAKTGKEIVF